MHLSSSKWFLAVLYSALLYPAMLLAADVNETDVVLSTGSGQLHGSLLLPATAGESTEAKIAIALIISGSGPTDRNGNQPVLQNNHLKLLANGLAESGIASLRYDKRGIAASKQAGPKEEDLRFEQYVKDAAEWVDFLDKDKRFEKIIVIGHSEGSLIGMMATAQSDVDAFVSLAGAGRRADEILREQLSSQPSHILEMVHPVIDELVKGNTLDDVDMMLYALFRPSVQPYMISWFKYDPAVEIAKLEVPVLLLQGTTDIQTGFIDVELLALPTTDVEMKIIDGMNHILKVAPADRSENIATYKQPGLPIAPGLIESIVSFVTE